MNSYLTELRGESFFHQSDLLEVIRRERPSISASSVYRMIRRMLAEGEIIRVGRDAYCVPERSLLPYRHRYSEQACDLAEYIRKKHPKISFRIFETVQLNEFLNHQIGRNVIFLSVEEDLGSFLFDELRDRYNNNVLLYPGIDIYHQYWKEDMIVIEKLLTEAPKGEEEFWHTSLEKILVDILADRLQKDLFSESEYPTIYETAFEQFVVDESRMFRYARRRNVKEKMINYLRENTSVRLRTM